MNGEYIIDFQGKKVGLFISMWAIQEMSRISNQQPESLIWKTVSLVQAAHNNYVRRNKGETHLPIADIEILVDDLYSTEDGAKIIAELTETLTQSYAFKSLNAEAIESDEKKSLTLTT